MQQCHLLSFVAMLAFVLFIDSSQPIRHIIKLTPKYTQHYALADFTPQYTETVYRVSTNQTLVWQSTYSQVGMPRHFRLILAMCGSWAIVMMTWHAGVQLAVKRV